MRRALLGGYVFRRLTRAGAAIGTVAVVLAGGCLWAAGTAAARASDTPAAAPAASTAAVTNGHCDPVWFIGARGSGESASGWNGMGKEVGYLAQVAYGDLQAKNLRMAYLPVDYSADSVDDLNPDSTVVSLLKEGDIAAAAVDYIHSSVDKYDASMNRGITMTEDAVAAALGQCPNAKLILSGYSQGAVAIHDAENWLVKHKPAEFSHIAGTLLLADPDRVADTTAKRFGTAPADAAGIRAVLGLVTPHDVPAPAATAEIADADDLVADFDPTFKQLLTSANRKKAAGVHTTYYTDHKSLLAAAATWVVGKIPGLSFTDAAIKLGSTAYGTIPAGRVTAKRLAASGGKAPYSYGIDSLDFASTPRWVTLTAGGALTISPPAGTVGSYSFPVYATDHTGRSSRLAAVTFSVGAAPPLSWYAADVPYPAGSAKGSWGSLDGVACGSPSSCVDIGDYWDPEALAGQLSTWSGGAWSGINPPVPANADPAGSSATLDTEDVACASASHCVVAGQYLNAAGSWDSMVLTWSGKSWTSVEAPRPAGATSTSTVSNDGAVSCASPSFCAVGGSYQNASDGTDALLMTSSGGSWTARPLPLPANADANPQAVITSVSCPSASFCAVDGQYVDKADSWEPLVATWSDSAWTVRQAPVPAAADPAVLSLGSVSCASPSSCVADAWFSGSAGAAGALLTWSGKSWSVAVAPLPGDIDTKSERAFEGFTGLSCSSSFCAAIGEYEDASGNSEALLEARSGGAWRVSQAPLPPNAAANPEAGLNGVSCTASLCAAGGSYEDPSGDVDGLMLAWSGGAWTAAQVKAPADDADNPGVVDVAGVSCVGSFCSAYGEDNGMVADLELQWSSAP